MVSMIQMYKLNKNVKKMPDQLAGHSQIQTNGYPFTVT